MSLIRLYIIVAIPICLTFRSFAQGEMEKACMKRIKDFSKNIDFPKFTGHISISKDTIEFDSSIIIIHDTDPKIRKLFELGLLFPDLIYGASTSGDKYVIRKSHGTDTLNIDVSELHFPNQRADTRSFALLLARKELSNPFLYLFELTNETADSKMNLKQFIEKAKVTAFGFCSIIL